MKPYLTNIDHSGKLEMEEVVDFYNIIDTDKRLLCKVRNAVKRELVFNSCPDMSIYEIITKYLNADVFQIHRDPKLKYSQDVRGLDMGNGLNSIVIYDENSRVIQIIGERLDISRLEVKETE